MTPFSYLKLPPTTLYISLFAVTLCFVLYYLIYLRRTVQWRKANIPFLQPTFLLGHKYFVDLIKNSYLVPLDRIYRENSDKDAVGFFMGTIPLVLLRNPRLIQQVFAKNFDKTFQTGWAGDKNDEVAQNMIALTADKEVWKSNRKTLAPVFSTSRMGGEQFDKISKQVDNLYAHAQEALLRGDPLNVREIIHNFWTDATSLQFFGQETDSYKEKGTLHQVVTDFFEPSLMRMLGVFAQIQFPGAWWMLDSLKFISRKYTDGIEKILSHQIQEKGQQNTKGDDFVDFLMRLKHENKSKEGIMNSGLNMNQMVGIALGVTCEGRYSSVYGANFAVHLLSLHPEYQSKIRDEVLEAMQKHKSAELTFEVVQDLPFTHQCMLETIRLYPSVPAIFRTCTEDFKVAGTEYSFKKGDRLIIDPYSVHRDSKHFKNPDAFDPDRFNPENKGSMAPESFLGFGLGPRKCPGWKIGVMMASTIIAALLLRYDIKPHSHMKQMDAKDFHPRCFINRHRQDILVDLLPRETTVQ